MREHRFFALSIAFLAAAVVGFPNGERRTVTLDHGSQDPAVSPDGKQIALIILGRIFVLPSDGGEASELTDGIGWDTHPAWSPDGRFVAYAHQLPNGTDLVIRAMATGGSRVVYHTNSALGQIVFHPQGKDIFFLLDRNQLDSHLWRVPIAGGEAKQLTFTENWHEWSFALSPDGKEALLDSGRFGGSNLYRLVIGDQSATRLTHSPNHQYSVAWSRDGSTWAYIDRDNGVDNVMVQAPAGTPRRVFSSEYDGKQLSLFPDGHSAVLSAGRKLYRLDLTSGTSKPILFHARIQVPEISGGNLAVTHARLFDGTGSDPLQDRTIELKNGRIVSIHEGVELRELGAETAVLDAKGRMVMSALMDNHYHYWSPFVGAMLLSRGITTIRDPGVEISMTMNFRDAIGLGIAQGPDLFTCGPLIDGLGGYHPMVDVELSKPEAAAALVRSLKAQGVDALKVYFMLEPDVLASVIREAQAQGLPVTGHIGVRTGWRQAMDSGINGLTHIRVWKDMLPPERQPQGEDESLDAARNTVPRMQADWSAIDPNGAAAGEIIQMMLAKQVGFDPTLSIQKIGNGLRSRLSLEQFSVAEDSYKKMSEFVGRAYKSGVRILAGTDDGNLFDEMEAYSAAGIPNAEVLRTATINGAIWLGKQADFGTVEPGKRGNLIVVNGDPLRDMKDIRKIDVVVKDGNIVFEN